MGRRAGNLMYRRTTRQRIILAALLAASATVVTLDFRENPGGPVRRVQDAAVTLIAPLQDGIASVLRPVGEFLSSIGELATLRQENEELRRRVETLESEQRRFPAIASENERLRSLLEVRDWDQGEFVGARVIGEDPSNYEWTAFLDKGARDGVKENMTVVASEGLVGRISFVAESYSKALLIIDSDHSVGARLTTSGETGVLSGGGRDNLRFDLIDAETNVDIDETVVTSGYDLGIYPPGIPIGRVVRSTTAPSGLEKSAFVRPFVDFSRLDFVKILIESGPIE